MRGMHVIEEEVGPFSEVGQKPKGEDMGKPIPLYMEAILPHRENFSDHCSQEKS